MTEDQRQRWKERRLFLRQMIEEKRRSAHAPDQRRYRALVSVGLITGAIILAGALTTWVKMCHRLETTAALASPSPAVMSQAKPTRVSITSRLASSHFTSAGTRRVSWMREHDRQVVIRPNNIPQKGIQIPCLFLSNFYRRRSARAIRSSNGTF